MTARQKRRSRRVISASDPLAVNTKTSPSPLGPNATEELIARRGPLDIG